MSRLTCQWCILSKVKLKANHTIRTRETIQDEKQPYLSLVFISLGWRGTRSRRFCSSWFTSSTQEQIFSQVRMICRFNCAGFVRAQNRKPSSLAVLLADLLLTRKTKRDTQKPTIFKNGCNTCLLSQEHQIN